MMGVMGVYKKRSRWYLRLPKQADGRRVSKSLGPHIKTKAEALRAEQALAQEGILDKLAHLDPSRKTLGELRRAFLAGRPIKPKSLARYEVCLRMLAESVGDQCLIRALTAQKLQQWSKQRLAQGVSRAGVNCDLRHVRAALNWAEEAKWIEKAPKVKMLKAATQPRHIMPDDVGKILSAEKDRERRRLWVFFLWTGCRRSEALNLRWQDIHWEPSPMALVCGKGDKKRWVPLLPAVVEALGDKKDLGPVFPQTHPDTYTHWFRGAARRVGIKAARLHDLRHTAATYMVSRGVPVRTVQEVLGHANIATTEVYTKALIGDLYSQMMIGVATPGATAVATAAGKHKD